MSNLIQLLPDHIANQIAAGEVVQRPASVVKELVENAIDAGATKINLVAKDGGKTLIQVIDNGSGMSDTDARMCFERHATSKIKSADDLFSLHTKGFRGEALASIAAVAHVELKTKLTNEDLGTILLNEGSEVVKQEPCSTPQGTSISVKNLFYNIPARRNFLGANTTEYRHLLNEFLRVALVHHEVAFSFHHNGDEIYNLPPEGLRQRIVHVFGKNYNNRLVPVEEETDIIKIRGFVTKPEFARTSRDQMYLFVNDRYFKDRYFNHAIMSAFDGMIPSNKFPSYFLYFDVPTTSIDVNVHPTKTEIKFEHNQELYSIIRSSVKQALGKFNVAPTLDFEQERSFDVPSLKKGESVKIPTIQVNPDFNPFKSTAATTSSPSKGQFIPNENNQIKPNPSDWENFYGNVRSESASKHINDGFDDENDSPEEVMILPSKMDQSLESNTKAPYQLHEKYIISPIKNGFIMIDQYRAHLRVAFDKYMAVLSEGRMDAQQLLFPEVFELSATDLVYLEEFKPQLESIGFDFEVKNNKTIEVKSVPSINTKMSAKQMLEDIIQEYKEHLQSDDINFNAVIAEGMARAEAVKKGVKLSVEEMQHLIDELFASQNPQYTPSGNTIVVTYYLDDIIKKFS